MIGRYMRGVRQLAGGLHGQHACSGRTACPVGMLTFGLPHRLLHLVDADAAAGQRLGIHLHAHGVLL